MLNTSFTVAVIGSVLVASAAGQGVQEQGQVSGAGLEPGLKNEGVGRSAEFDYWLNKGRKRGGRRGGFDFGAGSAPPDWKYIAPVQKDSAQEEDYVRWVDDFIEDYDDTSLEEPIEAMTEIKGKLLPQFADRFAQDMLNAEQEQINMIRQRPTKQAPTSDYYDPGAIEKKEKELAEYQKKLEDHGKELEEHRQELEVFAKSLVKKQEELEEYEEQIEEIAFKLRENQLEQDEQLRAAQAELAKKEKEIDQQVDPADQMQLAIATLMQGLGTFAPKPKQDIKESVIQESLSPYLDMLYRPTEMSQVQETRGKGEYAMALSSPQGSSATRTSWSAKPVIDYNEWKQGRGKSTGPTSSLPTHHTPGAGYAEANWAQNGGRGNYGSTWQLPTMNGKARSTERMLDLDDQGALFDWDKSQLNNRHQDFASQPMTKEQSFFKIPTAAYH